MFGDRESAPRNATPGGCFITCTGRERRMSTPIRTWSPDSAIRPNWSRNAAPADHGTSGGWRGCWPSRWPRWPGPGTPSRCGIAAVRAAPGDRMLSDAEWAQVAARGHGSDRARARRGMSWGCGGSRSATPPITFISWRRWPARTAPGRGSGMTSTGCGRPARTPRPVRAAVHRPGGSHRGPAPGPFRDGAGSAARMGRAAPGDAAPGGVHRGGRGAHGAGVLRPPRRRRGGDPQAIQHHQSW